MTWPWKLGGVALLAVLAALAGAWIARRPDPPPLVAPREPEVGRTDPAVAELARAVVALQARVEADQTAARRQTATDYGPAFVALLNSVLASQGRQQLPQQPTPKEVQDAADEVGALKLTEETLGPGPAGDTVDVTALQPCSGCAVRLLGRWHDYQAPAAKAPMFQGATGTRYYALLGVTAWGSANLTLADELAASSLQLDSTYFGWQAGLGVERLWAWRGAQIGLELEATYRDSSAVQGWQVEVNAKPGIFRERD